METLVYAVNSYQPEYALTLRNTGWGALRGQWWFNDMYQEIASFDHVTIYERQEPEKEPVEVAAEVDYAGGLELTSVSFADPELSPGEDMVAWLNLSIQEAQPPDLSIGAQLVDAQTLTPVTGAKSEPFGGWYGSDRWQPGDKLSIPIRLPVPADMSPGTYRLGLTVIDPALEGSLPLAAAPDTPDPSVQIGWLRLGGPEAPDRANDLDEEQTQVRWQNGIELTSLALPRGSFTAGEILPIWLNWRPSQAIERDLTVFVHLVDQTGGIVAQQDQRPFGGRWPTQVWQPGQLYSDLYEITLPDTLPAGEYTIRLGLYDAAGRAPLPTEADDAWEWSRPVSIE